LDNKKAVDSILFKKNQRDNWENIIKVLNQSRGEIKKLILDNYVTLKEVSDLLDKINKSRDEIKDDQTRKIREEWLNYIKNMDNELLSAIVNSMSKSMDELKKAVKGDKNKKEPKVFIQISTLWKAEELLIDTKTDINVVRKDLETIMNTVTNFQENCATLSSDSDLTFETNKDQKHFFKIKNIDDTQKSMLDKINEEITKVTNLFTKNVQQLRDNKINISFKDK
jgi:DNA-binding transcriptional MerR regulator